MPKRVPTMGIETCRWTRQLRYGSIFIIQQQSLEVTLISNHYNKFFYENQNLFSMESNPWPSHFEAIILTTRPPPRPIYLLRVSVDFFFCHLSGKSFLCFLNKEKCKDGIFFEAFFAFLLESGKSSWRDQLKLFQSFKKKFFFGWNFFCWLSALENK